MRFPKSGSRPGAALSLFLRLARAARVCPRAFVAGGMIASALAFAPPLVAQETAGVADAQLTNMTVDDAVAIAVANNESAAIADEEVIKTKALLLERRSAALPHLTGAADYKYNIFEPTTDIDFTAFNPLMAALDLPPIETVEQPLAYKHEWNFTLTLTQNLYTFGRIGNAIRLAHEFEDISRHRVDLTDEEIALAARAAFFDVLLMRDLVVIAEQNVKLSEAHVNDVRLKFKAGLRSDYDVSQNEAELAESQAQRIDAENRLDLARRRLLSAMGLSPDREVTVAGDFAESVPHPALGELVTAARAEREELAILTIESQSARTRARLFVADMMPSLSASTEYRYNGLSQTEEDRFWPVEDDWNSFWYVGATVSWPIFDGLANYGRYKQARADERINRLRGAQSARGVELEVTEAVRRIEALEQQLAARKQAAELADRAFRLAEVRYDAGLGTTLEMADAKAVWTRARVSLLQTLHELNVNGARLRRAVGSDLQ
ncbi:TolC family protein [bacterium]|nr:TolC family protein [bacterium]